MNLDMNESVKKYFEGYEHFYFKTSDDVKISVFHHPGQGIPLILIPGWTSNVFNYALIMQPLAEKHDVYVIENRGHGYSDQVKHGYRLSRLAKDIYELVLTLDSEKVILCGHSMGCSVCWSYIDLFGTDTVEKLIMGDEPPLVNGNPEDTEEELLLSGGQRFDMYQFINSYTRRGWKEGNAVFDRSFRSAAFPEPDYSRPEFEGCAEVAEAEAKLKMACDPVFLGMLLFDHVPKDWRDLIPRINIPSLLLTGDNSIATNLACARWIVDSVPDCRWERFTKEEGGTHNLFVNCHERVAQVMLDFIEN